MRRLYVVSYLFFSMWRRRVNMAYHLPSLYVNSEADVFFVSDNAFYGISSDRFSYGEEFDRSEWSLVSASSVSEALKRIQSSEYSEKIFHFPATPWYRAYMDAIAERIAGEGSVYGYVPGTSFYYEDRDRFRSILGAYVTRKGRGSEIFFRTEWAKRETVNFFSQRSTVKERTTPACVFADYIVSSAPVPERRSCVSDDGSPIVCEKYEGDLYDVDNFRLTSCRPERDDFPFAYPFVPVEDRVLNDRFGLCGSEPVPGSCKRDERRYPCDVLSVFGTFSGKDAVEAFDFVYERSVVGRHGEILKYIPVGVDSGEYRRVYGKTVYGNDPFTGDEIRDVLERTYASEALPICDCPECLDGKIYRGNGSYFCSSCDLRLIDAFLKKKGVPVPNKREARLLFKNGFVTLGKGFGGRRYRYRKSGKWTVLFPV